VVALGSLQPSKTPQKAAKNSAKRSFLAESAAPGRTRTERSAPANTVLVHTIVRAGYISPEPERAIDLFPTFLFLSICSGSAHS